MSFLLRKINYAPVWSGFQSVWGAKIHHPSADRWLYLLLNNLGLQGRLSRAVIEAFAGPGMTAIDIGANVGLYAALLSRCVGPAGRVLAFEPVEELQESLRRMIARNGLTNVQVFGHALGAGPGTSRLALDPFNSGNNWISDRNPAGTVQVQVKPLDDVELGEAPDFVKIDVQGWEVQVLRGMQGVLTGRQPPVVYCEVSESALQAAGSSASDLCQILLEHGYDLRLPILKNNQLEIREIEAQQVVMKARHTLYFDILAVHPGSRC